VSLALRYFGLRVLSLQVFIGLFSWPFSDLFLITILIPDRWKIISS
jgi:hypothetical protein